MTEWIRTVAILTAIGLVMWLCATYARRIEDDSDGMVEGNLREPYGTKFLRILCRRDGDR